jgi:hypothetical protein
MQAKFLTSIEAIQQPPNHRQNYNGEPDHEPDENGGKPWRDLKISPDRRDKHQRHEGENCN